MADRPSLVLGDLPVRLLARATVRNRPADQREDLPLLGTARRRALAPKPLLRTKSNVHIGGILKTIEEYAVELVADGAESFAEDDLNEDGEIANDQHEQACDLAIEIAHAIKAQPEKVLELVNRRLPMDTPEDIGRAAVVEVLDRLAERIADEPPTADGEGSQREFVRLIRIAAEEWAAGVESRILLTAVRTFLRMAKEID